MAANQPSNGVEGSTPKPVGSYPPSGIDVLIVGTGLAGLSASIECIRKGHKVKVLERNHNINTSGECPCGCGAWRGGGRS
jgi:succinate dehydrogenase/fumarate reductase flavoprotein subunit